MNLIEEEEVLKWEILLKSTLPPPQQKHSAPCKPYSSWLWLSKNAHKRPWVINAAVKTEEHTHMLLQTRPHLHVLYWFISITFKRCKQLCWGQLLVVYVSNDIKLALSSRWSVFTKQLNCLAKKLTLVAMWSILCVESKKWKKVASVDWRADFERPRQWPLAAETLYIIIRLYILLWMNGKIWPQMVIVEDPQFSSPAMADGIATMIDSGLFYPKSVYKRQCMQSKQSQN